MTKHFLFVLMAILLLMESGAAQTRRKQINSPRAGSGINDIRRINFLDFTYQSSLCAEDFSVPGMVKLRRGKFQDKESYYRVISNKVVYGDVTADGRAEAVVPIICGAFAGNYNNSEIFIYTLQNGQAKLLAKLDTKSMEHDYLRYYPGGFFVTMANNGVKVKNGYVVVEMLADGSNAAPEHIVTLNYKLRGASIALNGKPQRRRNRYFGQE
jgi:hypothetical protein